MKNEPSNLVKVTSKGKVSITVHAPLKAGVKHLLETFIHTLSVYDKVQLDLKTGHYKVYHALMCEVYTRHFTALSMLHQPCKLLVTQSQATAFWELCQEHDHKAFNMPMMGGLLLQLHQKLS